MNRRNDWCNACGGMGYVGQGSTCQTCGGTGNSKAENIRLKKLENIAWLQKEFDNYIISEGYYKDDSIKGFIKWLKG